MSNARAAARILALLLQVMLATGCSTLGASEAAGLQRDLQIALQRVVTRNPDIAGVAVHVEMPGCHLSCTVRHLLTHTSGLHDFGGSDEYIRLCEQDPRRHWTREDQLRFAMPYGKPYGAPGRVFAYSDTGYILLGEILERSTETMARALFRGRIHAHAGTVATMLTTARDAVPGPPAYGVPQHPAESGMGILVRRIDGMRVYMHTGHWGTLAAHVPDLDASVAISVTQQAAHEQREQLLRTVLRHMPASRSSTSVTAASLNMRGGP